MNNRIVNKIKSKIKKNILFLIALTLFACAVTACGKTAKEKGQEAGVIETNGSQDISKKEISITALDGKGENVEITVPFDPQRIAVLDFAALDILDSLGLGDRVVGTANTKIEYLASYSNDSNIANLGTIKEADLEAIMASEPDVIFIGGRLAGVYNELLEIAPVVHLANDYDIGIVNSVEKNATTIASMFGLENEVREKVDRYSERMEQLQVISNGKTALIGLTTSGSFNLLGSNSRCSIIGDEVGFHNLTTEVTETAEIQSGSSSTHGNESSFETIVAKNPDYIFVLDRDNAIGTEGVRLAQEIMENELVKDTKAYQNGNVIYLENSAVWYTAEGGLQALDIMIQDLEKALN